MKWHVKSSTDWKMAASDGAPCGLQLADACCILRAFAVGCCVCFVVVWPMTAFEQKYVPSKFLSICFCFSSSARVLFLLEFLFQPFFLA